MSSRREPYIEFGIQRELGKDVLAVVSGTFKTDDPWAAQNGIGGRGQQSGICVMLWPHERRIQAFKDLETARQFMSALCK